MSNLKISEILVNEATITLRSSWILRARTSRSRRVTRRRRRRRRPRRRTKVRSEIDADFRFLSTWGGNVKNCDVQADVSADDNDNGDANVYAEAEAGANGQSHKILTSKIRINEVWYFIN